MSQPSRVGRNDPFAQDPLGLKAGGAATSRPNPPPIAQLVMSTDNEMAAQLDVTDVKEARHELAVSTESVTERSTPRRKTKTQSRQVPKQKSEGKEKITVRLQKPIADRMRRAVHALSGRPTHFTIANFFDDAVEALLKETEREYNNGKPFPPIQ